MVDNKDTLKIPPHSIEAEQSVLGGLMLDNQAWDIVTSKITEEDFYRFEHRVIFRALQSLSVRESPFDVITEFYIGFELLFANIKASL